MKHPPGKQYWRGLEELAASDEFVEFVRREFPEQAAAMADGVSRRRFLTLMGASLALAGIGGCSVRPAPSTEMVPYVDQPEGVVPGKPLFFATTMTMGGDAVGLLVESHTGRPTKIEGNPDHPASRGGTSIFHQASILTLYDPDRAQTPTYLGNTKSWPEVLDVIRPKMTELRAKRGAGFRLLTESVISPTLAWQLDRLLADLPEAKWHVWEPIHRDAERRGLEIAFGEPVRPVYNFGRADVVLSLDADFLNCSPGRLGDAADFMARRRVRDAGDVATATMNRLYVAETAVSCTGVKADHRLALRPAQIEQLARAVAARLGIDVAFDATGLPKEWIEAVAKDLDAHRGRSLVLAGDMQPPEVHLLAHLLNDRLGNVGNTVTYVEPNDAPRARRPHRIAQRTRRRHESRRRRVSRHSRRQSRIYCSGRFRLLRAPQEGAAGDAIRPVRR